MAIEESNGAVGDYEIKYFIEDDRNDPTEAVNVADKLISQNKVHVIIGSVTSSATIPVTEVANNNKVVQVTSTATAETVTVDNGQRKEYVFRTCFLDAFQGKAGAIISYEDLGARTAAILYDQGNEYSKGLAEVFRDTFQDLGGQVLSYEAYIEDDTDFSAQLTNIAAQNVDVLYLPDYYQKVSLIGKQARDKGIEAIFVGADGFDSAELDFITMEGSYYTNHYAPDEPRPEVQSFVEKYKEKYGEVPDALGTLCYDATRLVLNAIKTAGSNDPAAIKDALQATSDFDTVSGALTFDENGNPVKSAVICTIQDGKPVYVRRVDP